MKYGEMVKKSSFAGSANLAFYPITRGHFPTLKSGSCVACRVVWPAAVTFGHSFGHFFVVRAASPQQRSPRIPAPPPQQRGAALGSLAAAPRPSDPTASANQQNSLSPEAEAARQRRVSAAAASAQVSAKLTSSRLLQGWPIRIRYV
eukprot:1184800-Prorocentrum_minimum.AAC.2